MGEYKVKIFDGDEAILDTKCSSHPKELKKVLEGFAEGKTEEQVESLKVVIEAGEDKIEDTLKDAIGGLQTVPPDAAMVELQRTVAKLAAVSDFQIGLVTILSKSGGPKGFTAIFDKKENIDSDSVSKFVNAAAAHVKVARSELGKDYDIHTQEDEQEGSPIIIPGRDDGQR